LPWLEADSFSSTRIKIWDLSDHFPIGIDLRGITATCLGELTYPLKQKRPDLLLGNADSMKRGRAVYPEDSVMSWFWCGLNSGKADVREHFLEFIRWYCSRYDFDGRELDYYRHPLFFRISE